MTDRSQTDTRTTRRAEMRIGSDIRRRMAEDLRDIAARRGVDFEITYGDVCAMGWTEAQVDAHIYFAAQQFKIDPLAAKTMALPCAIGSAEVRPQPAPMLTLPVDGFDDALRRLRDIEQDFRDLNLRIKNSITRLEDLRRSSGATAALMG